MPLVLACKPDIDILHATNPRNPTFSKSSARSGYNVLLKNPLQSTLVLGNHRDIDKFVPQDDSGIDVLRIPNITALLEFSTPCDTRI